MSITFKSPTHLVMLSDANPSELKIIVEVLKNPSYFLNLESEKKVVNKTKAPKADVKTMTIRSMSQYPSLTGVGFPKTLTELTISRLNYRHLENRICALEFLRMLDLSHNQLKKLPWCLWEMKSLISLDVEDNQISDLPSAIPENSHLCKNIQYLNISNNRLDTFPVFLRHCKLLNTLKIAGNPIKFVPNFFKSCSSTLRVLDIEKCLLKNLPACLTHFSLNELKLDGNIFPPHIKACITQRSVIYKGKCGKSWSPVPSLQACCVKSIVRHRVHVSPQLPEHLLTYINSFQYCDGCFKLVMENSFVYYYPADLSKFARVYPFRLNRRAVITGFVCSSQCFKRVQGGKNVVPAIVYFNQQQ